MPPELPATSFFAAARLGLDDQSLARGQVDHGLGLVGHEVQRGLARPRTGIIPMIIEDHHAPRRQARVEKRKAVECRLLQINVNMDERIFSILHLRKPFGNPAGESLEAIELLEVGANLCFRGRKVPGGPEGPVILLWDAQPLERVEQMDLATMIPCKAAKPIRGCAFENATLGEIT